MTSDYATLPPDITAQQAIDKLRKEAPDKETIYYCYVVDEQRRLLGFVSLKDLILAKPDTLVKEIMNKDLIYAHVLDDQEEVARKIQKYDLIALPVVNGNDALVGIITYDDAMDIITQEHTEDMEKLMAITGEHEAAAYMKTPVIEHFKNRCGWLIFLALLGFVSGFIVQKFENVIMQFTILATFMPMLADTGGNTGSQSATLVIRALALKEITPRDFLRVIYKEFNISLLLGIALAFVAILRVYFYALTTPTYHLPLTKIGMAVGVALSLQVISSTLIGAILPLIAARFKTDPAVVASPALTTIVDITGLFIFFYHSKNYFRNIIMQTLTLFPYDIARYNSFLEQIKGNHLMVTEKIERFPEVFLHVASDTDYNKSDLVIPTDIFSLYRDIIVSQSGRGLIEEVTEMLKRYKLTISVAESCTGGLISHLLTQVSGSSNYFILGAITYSNYAKTKILGVPNDILKKIWGST